MKFKEFVNLIDDKIDYLFRRGKNADERCFDYFIRTVTFFVVVLIVLCYASFVHADEAFTTLSATGDYTDVFNSDDLNTWLSSKGLSTSDITTVGIVSGLNSYPFAISDLPSLKIPSSIDFNGKTYYPEDYYIFLHRGNLSDHGIDYLTCSIVVGDDIVIGYGGTTVYSFLKQPIGVFGAAINPNNLNQIWDGNPVYSQVSNQVHEGYNGFDTSITYNYWNCPTPAYYCNKEIYSLLLDDTIDANVRSDFAYQSYHYPNNVIQINYLYDMNNPQEPEVPEAESNLNHLYLNDIQVALTSNGNGTNLLSSEVVIGCKADDWILNHVDDYSLYVSFALNAKDTMPSNPNDPTSNYSVIVPLRAFMSDHYSVGVAEILKNCKIEGYGNFLDYYNALNDGGIEVLAKNTFNGILYFFLESHVQGLGDYFVKTIDNFSGTPYTVFDFDLNVAVTLVDNSSGSQSEMYIKEFDFANGTSSVKFAELLRNQNPWTGEETPQQSPLIPSAGGGNSGGYYSGGSGSNINNINITSGNGYQDTELHQLTKKDIEENHINIIRTIESLRDCFEKFAEVKNDKQSFLQMIFTEFYEIPGVAYMVLSLIVVFSVMVLIFIIKIAF